MTSLALLLIFTVTAVSALLLIPPESATVTVQQRIRSIRRRPVAPTTKLSALDEEMALPFTKRVLAPMMNQYFDWVFRRASDKAQANLQQRLMQAGNPIGPSAFLGMRIGAVAVTAFFSLLVFGPSLRHQPMLAGSMVTALPLLGWRLPELWLSKRITKRRRDLEKALPDVLDVLSISVEAGLGLDGAIQKVSEKFKDPVAGEFQELLKSIRLGTSRSEALRALADRTGLEDVRTFTAAVIQADMLGVSISRVLKAQSEALRIKRKQRAQEKAMALPLKMLFPLILFIFPTLFIVLLGPAILNIMDAF